MAETIIEFRNRSDDDRDQAVFFVRPSDPRRPPVAWRVIHPLPRDGAEHGGDAVRRHRQRALGAGGVTPCDRAFVHRSEGGGRLAGKLPADQPAGSRRY